MGTLVAKWTRESVHEHFKYAVSIFHGLQGPVGMVVGR